MKQSRVRKLMSEHWRNSLQKTSPDNKELCKALRVMGGVEDEESKPPSK